MEEALIAAGPLEASVGRLKFPLERPKKVLTVIPVGKLRAVC